MRFAYGDPHRARYVVTYVAGSGTSLGKAGGALEDGANLVEAAQHLRGPNSADDIALIVNTYQIKKPTQLGHPREVYRSRGCASPGAVPTRAPCHSRSRHSWRRAGEVGVGIQHSYGNIVAAEAPRAHDYAVDALVINGVGSMGINRADDLGIPEVYATLMETDPLHVVRWFAPATRPATHKR